MITGLIIAVGVLSVAVAFLLYKVIDNDKEVWIGFHRTSEEIHSAINESKTFTDSKVDDVKRLIVKLYEKEKEAITILKDYYSSDFKDKCLDIAIKMHAQRGGSGDTFKTAKEIEDYLLCNEDKEDKQPIKVKVGDKIGIKYLDRTIISRIVDKSDDRVLTVTLVDNDIIWFEVNTRDGGKYKFPVLKTSINV